MKQLIALSFLSIFSLVFCNSAYSLFLTCGYPNRAYDGSLDAFGSLTSDSRYNSATDSYEISLLKWSLRDGSKTYYVRHEYLRGSKLGEFKSRFTLYNPGNSSDIHAYLTCPDYLLTDSYYDEKCTYRYAGSSEFERYTCRDGGNSAVRNPEATKLRHEKRNQKELEKAMNSIKK